MLVSELNDVQGTILKMGVQDTQACLGQLDLHLSGLFDLTSSIPTQNLGFAVCRKVASSEAPTDAIDDRIGNGYGAVAWLSLETSNVTVGSIRAIYRVNTAGRNPPTICSGMPDTFNIDYAAEYWFYRSP